MKRDYAFVEFSDARDADDARYSLDGRDVDGHRIIVEFAKGTPRGPGGAREYAGRGPAPGTGRCFNCGLDGHWARDCKAGDWKNKCYRCGERGHIERDCRNSPKKTTGRGRSYSRSPVRSRSRSRSPRRGRSRSRTFSRSRSYSRSRSPARRRERDIDRKERRSKSPYSPEEPKRSRSLSEARERSSTPIRRGERERGGYSESNPKRGESSPPSGGGESPNGAANGVDRSPSPSPSPRSERRSPVEDDDNGAPRSPRGSLSP